ncbi:hypothetical protein [Opitutus terrae]|uniref:hypothetical protein n=1 Tax=Opitutus terrae TaxID=107709 RepID=UPI0002D8E678|nr:hypothetical protein [Opitutus terrae]
MLLHHPDGRITTGKIDLYRRDRFLLEAKQTAAAVRPENVVDTSEAELDLGLTHSAPNKRAADPYGKAMLEAVCPLGRSDSICVHPWSPQLVFGSLKPRPATPVPHPAFASVV